MSAKQSSIASKSLWTIGTYAASASIRFGSNIVLSRLLAPEIMGIVVIAQAIRTGSDLLTDLGPEQNVVHSPHGDDEKFLNTVWSMQIIRGSLASLLCLCLSPLLARFYRVDVAILAVVSAAPLLNSLMSTSVFSLSRTLNVKSRNLFELASEAIGLILIITLAFTLRNVWAPLLGIILSIGARSAISYLLPHPRHRFVLDKVHSRAIFHFSKWISLSSIAFYAAIFVDRLFLGRVVSLGTLGIYGLAKAIAELPITVAGRLAFQIVFPFVANHGDDLGKGSPARAELARTRSHFLLLVLVGTGTVMAWSDWIVIFLYGHRYAAAGWMLCIMLISSWIATLSSLNEATVFGRGKTKSVSIANVFRFVMMATLLPTGFALMGLPGAIFALLGSELTRYCILMRTQIRIRTNFAVQDAMLSLSLLAVFGGWSGVRLALGLGVPWALMR
ncbi:MAG: oligosaccharide flippase family protein [Pseudomonadota bacterium]|nr:oligosaccharide flippase family protein [Pseudomonadota bacterium]